jgi:DNA-binding IclR family transcriptional regulator
MTQQEVVARSGFSDAKVSQTLKGLRERGLVYREPQGRTYRLYPGELLTEK